MFYVTTCSLNGANLYVILDQDITIHDAQVSSGQPRNGRPNFIYCMLFKDS